MTNTKELKTHTKFILFIIGFLESALFAGTIFGWPQLVAILKKEGIYSHLCYKNIQEKLANGTELELYLNGSFEKKEILEYEIEKAIPLECSAQDQRFALIFTIAVVCYMLPGYCIGMFLHRFGIKSTKIFACLTLIAAFFSLSLTTKDSPNWLFASAILQSFGCQMMRMGCLPLGDLFPQKSLCINMLAGSYAASGAFFLIFAISQNYGISKSVVCYGICIFLGTSAVWTFFLPYQYVNQRKKKSLLQPAKISTSIFSKCFFLQTFWFFVMLLGLNVYQQMFNVWINSISTSEHSVAENSMYFSFANLLALFTTPIGGILNDVIKKDSAYPMRSHLLPFLLATLSAFIIHICLLFSKPAAIWVSLGVYAILRPLAVSVGTAYTRERFPAQHFSRLIGIQFSILSLLMPIQLLIFYAAQDNPYIAGLIVISLVIASLLLPIRLTWWKPNAEKEEIE